jgi:anaerobic magnesium-protoporphyrin IX monomethyl ester cyclase
MARCLFIKVRMPDISRVAIAASPPLGLLYLAAYSRQQRPGKDEFRLVDERIHPLTDADYAEIIRTWKPDLIGLSILTTEAQRWKELARTLKGLSPATPIFVGGPHATAYGAKLFDEGPCDFIFRGESEQPFVQVLNAFDESRALSVSMPLAGGQTLKGAIPAKVSGLIFHRDDGSLYEVPYNDSMLNVEELPRPAWDLLDFSDYQDHPRMTPINHARYAPLFTSRGCPYRCIYCHDVFGKGFGAMSPKKVVDDIQYLNEVHNVHDFEIYDDIFNANPERVIAISEEIRRRGLYTRFTFPNGVRGDRLNKDVIDALAAMGTYHMAFAVESASPRIQKLIRKHNKLDKLAENIAYAADAGIFAWGFFMLGFPTETREELWSTVDFAVDSKLHGAFFFQVVPFGGTELAQKYYSDSPAMPEGMLETMGDNPGLGGGLAGGSSVSQSQTTRGTNDLSEGEASLAADYHFTANTLAAVSTSELAFIQRMAYLRFYYNPMRLGRLVRDYPVLTDELAQRGIKLSRYLFYEKPMLSAKRQLEKATHLIPGLPRLTRPLVA